MKRKILLSFVMSFSLLALEVSQAAHLDCSTVLRLLDYPKLRKLSKQVEFHDWIKSETDRANSYLESSPILEPLRARLKEVGGTNLSPRLDVGLGELFLEKGDLCLAVSENQKEILLKASSFPEGTVISQFRVSPDGTKILYSLVDRGSDVSYWQLYDLQSKQPLPDTPIRMRYGQIQWDSQSKGLFYSRWPKRQEEEELVDRFWSKRNVPLVYHKIGTSSKTDQVIFQNHEKHPSMIHGAVEVEPGKTLLVYRHLGTHMPLSLYWGEKKGNRYRWKIIQTAENPNSIGGVVGRSNDEVFIKSAECGNNYCLMAIKLGSPFTRRLAIPYDQHRVLDEVQVVGSLIQATYHNLSDTRAPLFAVSFKTFDLNGKELFEFRPSHFGLPDQGSLSTLTAHRLSQKGYFTYSAGSVPPITFSYDLKNLRVTRLKPTKPHPFDGPNPIKTEVQFYTSFDGTKIPIHVYTRTDLREPPKFALVYYYGALAVNNFSNFSSRWIAALELGGMVAVANVRGGGEHGFSWARAGAEDKMLTVKDIAWASKWLKKTYPIEDNKVFAQGGSWGGLHTYLALVNYPGEFNGFISDIPVSSIPYSWNNLFGWLLPDDTAVKRDRRGDIADFEGELHRSLNWSALESVPKMGAIAPIITFSVHNDERAGFEQGPFMTRALQERFGDQAPIYLHEREFGGHSAGPTMAEATSFIALETGITELKPMTKPVGNK